MKSITHLTRSISALCAAGVFLAGTTTAMAATYADGDVFLCFRATANPGATSDYMVNLGTVTQFTGASGQINVALGGDILADLETLFGTNWHSRADVQWSVSGVQKAIGNGFPANTIFASKAQPVSGTQSLPWQRPSSFSAGTPAGKIQSMGSRYALGTTSDGGVQTVSTANPKALIQATNITTSYAQFQPGGVSTTGATAYSYFAEAGGIENNFGNGAARSSVDFYEIVPGSGPATLRGGFRLTNAGQLIYETDIANLDVTTLQPILTNPAVNTSYTNSVSVNFTLPEAAASDTVKLKFTSGSSTYTLVLANSQGTAGAHSFTFDPAAPTSAAQVQSGAAIPPGIYTVSLSYQDARLNPEASDDNTGVDLIGPATAVNAGVFPLRATSATLNASVTPNSGTGTYTFLLDTANPPTTPVGSGSTTPGSSIVSAPVSGLIPGTEYFYRVEVVNDAGTVQSAVASFTTPAAGAQALFAKDGPVPFAGLTGSGIPAGATWTSFGVPAINDAGQIACIGKWKTPSPNKPGTAIFIDGRMIVKVGDSVNGFPGATYKTLKDPVIDNAGNIAFLADLKGGSLTTANDSVVVSNARGAGLEVLAQEGTAAPDSGGATYKSFKSVSISHDSISVLNSGPVQSGVVFYAQLTKASGTPAVDSTNDYGTWWLPQGAPDVLKMVREGDAFAGSTVKTFITLKSLGGSPAHGRGQYAGSQTALQITTANNAQYAVLAEAGTLTQLAGTGTALGGVALPAATWSKIGMPSTSSSGSNMSLYGILTPKVGGVLTADTKGIFASGDAGETWEPVARTLSTAPGLGTSAYFSAFKDPVNSSTDAGVAFIATGKGGSVLPATDTGIWWQPDGGALVLVAREGSQPPGAPALAQWKAFSSVALPGGGFGPVFVASLLKGQGQLPGPGGITGADDIGLYGTDSTGTVHELVREGQTLTGKTVRTFNVLKAVTGSNGVARAYNTAGSLILSVTFTDNTTAIVQVEVPNPIE